MDPTIVVAVITLIGAIVVALLNRAPQPKPAPAADATQRAQLYRYTSDAIDDARAGFDTWINSGGASGDYTKFNTAFSRLDSAIKDATLASPRIVIEALRDVIDAAHNLTKLMLEMGDHPDPLDPRIGPMMEAYGDARAKFMLAARNDLGSDALR
jgi:hypothetical protein